MTRRAGFWGFAGLCATVAAGRLLELAWSRAHEQQLADYEVTNWYLSNHPDSHFVNGLIAARAAPDRRYALRNNELAVHHLDGNTERSVLATVAQLRAALEGPFGLTLPDAPELDAALARFAARSA